MQTNEKGITLVTLAITIIVMMILASSLMLLNRADPEALELANEKNSEAELLSIKEEIKTDLTKNNPSNYQELIDKLKKYGTIENENDVKNATLITAKGEYNIKVTELWNTNMNPLARITGYEKRNTDTTDKEGNRIVVPSGFKVVNPEDTVNDGIVIEDVTANDENTVGNQFVWVPCTIDGENGSLQYDRYAFTRETPTWSGRQSLVLGENGEYEKDADGSYKIVRADNTSNYYHEAMPEEEKNSIKAYGGYYIGRYETGTDEARTESDQGNINPVGKIKSNLNVYNWIIRDEAKTLAERMYRGKSRLCSSYAWDTALKFIDGETGTYAINSVGDNCETNKLENTGYYAIKNIYDMGGNISEWVTEKYTDGNKQIIVYRRRWT